MIRDFEKVGQNEANVDTTSGWSLLLGFLNHTAALGSIGSLKDQSLHPFAWWLLPTETESRLALETGHNES